MLRRDRLVAHEDRRTREITAGLAEARSRQGIVTHRQGSARRERAGGTEREGHAAAETIVVSVGRTARAADGERGQDVARGGQILDAADRVGRRRAVGRGGIGHLNEELARRDDGIIAGDIVHRVVRRGQARRHEHARVSAGRAGRRVAAGDGQRAAEAGGDVGLTGHEAGEVRAVEADRIVLADETSIGIGRDGQRGRRDRGRDGRRGRKGVVPGVGPAEREAGEADGVRRSDVLGVIESDGRTADRDDIRTDDTGEDAGIRDHGGGGAVVDLGGRDGEAADRERPRGDGRRDRRGHRQRVVRGGSAGEGQAGEADGDRRGDVLAVIDAHRSAAQGDRITAEEAGEDARAGDDRTRGAVVDLGRSDAETGDGQRLRRDGGRDDVVGGDRVIARGGAAEGEAGEAHAGRGGDVLAVVETLGEAVERDRVAGDDAREGAATGDVGRDGAVVDLAGRDAEVAQGERARGDAAAQVAGRDHVVAADAAVGSVRDGIADAHGLARADVRVGEATDAGDDDGLRADQAREGAREDRRQGRAVVDLVHDARTADRQRLGQDLHRAGRAGQGIGDGGRRGRRRGEAGVIREGRRGQHVGAVGDGVTGQRDGRAVRSGGREDGAGKGSRGVVDLGAGDVQRQDRRVDVKGALGGDLIIRSQGAAADDADRRLAEGALVISTGGGGLGRATGAEQRDRLAGQLARGDRQLARREETRAVERLGAGQRQELRRDRRLIAHDRGRDDVVRRLRTIAGDERSEGDARDVDAVRRDDVRRIIRGGRPGGEGDRVARDEAAGHRDGVDGHPCGEGGRAVIDLRSRTQQTERERGRGDRRGRGSGAGDDIVGELAAQGGAGQRRDGEAAGDEGVGGGDARTIELHRRGPEGDRVAGEEIARRISGHDGADEVGGAVVGLGDPDVGERDADRARGDADRGGRADQGVIARAAGAVGEGESAQAAEAADGGDTGAVRRERGAGDGERLTGDAGDEQVGRGAEGGVAVVDLAGGDADLGRCDGDRIESRRQRVIGSPAGGAGYGDRAAREGAALIGADIRGAQGSRAGAEQDDFAREGAADAELGRRDGGRGVIGLGPADGQRARRDRHGARGAGELVVGSETAAADEREGRRVDEDVAGFDVGRAGVDAAGDGKRLTADRAADGDLAAREGDRTIVDLGGRERHRTRDDAEGLGGGGIVDDRIAGLGREAGADQRVGPDVIRGGRRRPGDRAGRVGRELGRGDGRTVMEIGRSAGQGGRVVTVGQAEDRRTDDQLVQARVRVEDAVDAAGLEDHRVIGVAGRERALPHRVDTRGLDHRARAAVEGQRPGDGRARLAVLEAAESIIGLRRGVGGVVERRAARVDRVVLERQGHQRLVHRQGAVDIGDGVIVGARTSHAAHAGDGQGARDDGVSARVGAGGRAAAAHGEGTELVPQEDAVNGLEADDAGRGDLIVGRDVGELGDRVGVAIGLAVGIGGDRQRALRDEQAQRRVRPRLGRARGRGELESVRAADRIGVTDRRAGLFAREGAERGARADGEAAEDGGPVELDGVTGTRGHDDAVRGDLPAGVADVLLEARVDEVEQRACGRGRAVRSRRIFGAVDLRVGDGGRQEEVIGGTAAELDERALGGARGRRGEERLRQVDRSLG